MKCTRCGKCCSLEVCELGLMFFDNNIPCKALELINNQYNCGLLIHADKYIDLGINTKWKNLYIKKWFSNLLGINKGCDSTL